MASIFVPDAYAAFTANGGADGYVTVGDNSTFFPSARVWLWSNTVSPLEYIVTDLVGSTKIGVRKIGSAPTYTRTDISTLLLADSAKIAMDGQIVRVEQPTYSKIPKA